MLAVFLKLTAATVLCGEYRRLGEEGEKTETKEKKKKQKEKKVKEKGK